MFPSAQAEHRSDQQSEDGRAVPSINIASVSDSEVRPTVTSTELSISSRSASEANANRDAVPPSRVAPPKEQDSDYSTPTVQPTPTSMPPATRKSSETSTDQSSGGTGTGFASSALPPPHALPTGSQPIMLQLNLPSNTDAQSGPNAGLPGNALSLQSQATTLPPAPAHPALALMRSGSASKSVPRRPLSAPRIPSAMRASIVPGHAPSSAPAINTTFPLDSTYDNLSRGNTNANAAPETGKAFGREGYGNSVGHGYGRGNNNRSQSVSYTTTHSPPEKDNALFDYYAPTSPSGRLLKVDLPRLEHRDGHAPTPGVGNAQDGQIDRESHLPYSDERQRYGDNGTRPSMTMPGAYLTGYSGEYNTHWQERAMYPGMGAGPRMSIGGGNGFGGGDGGDAALLGQNNGAYMNITNEMDVPRLPHTVRERLRPTLRTVKKEIDKHTRKAQMTGYALNTAIGLQVFLSALITALSAVTFGRRTQVMTSILGGMGTVVASYLARARGSNEPELSITRVKDLQRFKRACRAFLKDYGDETGWEGYPGYVPPVPATPSPRTGEDHDSNMEEDESTVSDTGRRGGEKAGSCVVREWDGGVRARELDERIRRLRSELEHLLGNGNGERKLSPPV